MYLFSGTALANSRGMRLVLHMVIAVLLFAAAILLAGCSSSQVAQW